MENVRGLSEGHPLQGPHRDLSESRVFISLILTSEPAGPKIEIQRPEVIVGRHSEADVRLALPDISRRHCRLAFEGEHWRVYDLNSLNGIFVNGERIGEATLHHGDHLQLGTFSFLVEYHPPARVEVLQSIAAAMK